MMGLKSSLMLALFALTAFCMPSTLAGTSGDFCQDCRSTMSYLSRFNSSNSQEAFGDALKYFCNIYYPTSMDYRNGPCEIVYNSAMYLLKNTDPVHHCDEIGACTTEPAKPIPASGSSFSADGPSSPDMLCDVCKTGVQSIKAQLSNERMLQQLKSTLESFCEYLEIIDESQECKVHIPVIINYIKNTVDKIDPQRYCETIKVCNPKTLPQSLFKQLSLLHGGLGLFIDGKALSQDSLFSKNQGEILSDVKVVTTTVIDDEGDDVDKIIEPKVQPILENLDQDKSHKKGPSCLLCKFVISELNHVLKDNRTEENIKNNLDHLCGKIYSKNETKKEKCQNLVDKYSAKIIEILAQEMNPEIVCILLEQCVYMKEDELKEVIEVKEQEKTGTISDLFVALDSSLVQGSFEVCVECKLFIKYLQQVLKDPESEREMKEVLKQNLCEKLSSPGKEECNKLIDKYAQILFESVSKNLKPGETCKKLGCCPKPHENSIENILEEFQNMMMTQLQTEKAKVSTPAPQVQGQLCDQCVQIVESIDKYISAEDVDNDVNKIVEKVCNKMEPSLAQKCAYIVETFGTEIISVISNMQDPKQVCQKVFLC